MQLFKRSPFAVLSIIIKQYFPLKFRIVISSAYRSYSIESSLVRSICPLYLIERHISRTHWHLAIAKQLKPSHESE